MTAFAAPTTETAVTEAVRAANSQNTAVQIIAGGTRGRIGRLRSEYECLDVSGVAGITHYEPGALTLEAKAGTPIVQIEAALDAENQMLAFEPMDHRALMGTQGTPTIGGVVACNVSGPRRFISGACRDFLLGVRFVDGQGRVIKNGGRVMKNVTGLDLTKLVCGSFGTLGVLTQVALKVLPRPERSATLQFEGVAEAEAVGIFCKAVSTPFEVNGAAWQNGAAMLRVEGLETQVSYRLGALQNLFQDQNPSVLEGDAHRNLWAGIRDIHAFAQTEDTIWKVALRPTAAPAFIAAARAHLNARAVLDQAGGLIWLAVPSSEPDQARVVRDLVPAGNGHATLVRGTTDLRCSVPVFHPQHPRLAQVSEGLRAQFDPKGILNPGLMAG